MFSVRGGDRLHSPPMSFEHPLELLVMLHWLVGGLSHSTIVLHMLGKFLLCAANSYSEHHGANPEALSHAG